MEGVLTNRCEDVPLSTNTDAEEQKDKETKGMQEAVGTGTRKRPVHILALARVIATLI
jgi:hypothetical protein